MPDIKNDVYLKNIKFVRDTVLVDADRLKSGDFSGYNLVTQDNQPTSSDNILDGTKITLSPYEDIVIAEYSADFYRWVLSDFITTEQLPEISNMPVLTQSEKELLEKEELDFGDGYQTDIVEIEYTPAIINRFVQHLHQQGHDTITEDIIANELNNQKDAPNVMEMLTTLGFINAEQQLSQNEIIPSAMYFNNKEISSEDRQKAEERVMNAIISNDFSQIQTDEYIVVGNYALSLNENNKFVATPILSDNVIPHADELVAFINEYKIPIEELHLTRNNNFNDNIVFTPNTKLSEYPDYLPVSSNGESSILTLMSLSENVIQDEEIFLFNEDITDRKQLPVIPESNMLYKDGAIYTMDVDSAGNLTCFVTQIKDNAVIKQNIQGMGPVVSDLPLSEFLSKAMATQELNENVLTEETPSSIDTTTSPSEQQPKDKPVIIAHTKKVSNSPHFGEGYKTIYEAAPTQMSPEQIKKLNQNEQTKLMAEIKVNKLYDDKNRLKAMDKRMDKGFFGLLRRAFWKPLRGLLYLIARPLVENLPMFQYNKQMHDINKAIQASKDEYYIAEINNDKILKKSLVKTIEDSSLDVQKDVINNNEEKLSTEINNSEKENVTEEAKTSPETENTQSYKPSYHKILAQNINKVAPIGSELSITTEKTDQGFSNILTFIPATQQDGISEIKFNIDKGGRLLTNTTAVDLPEQDIKNLTERVLVMQQLSRGKVDQAGISEDSWNKVSSNKNSKANSAQELIDGSAKNKTFYVNGIKTDVEALDNGNFKISALNGTSEVSRQTFAQYPRETINAIVYSMAVNKYMGYVCEKIPERISQSKHFQRNLSSKIYLSNPNVLTTLSGRPKVTIPLLKPNEGIAFGTISLDANNGNISFEKHNNATLTPEYEEFVKQTIDVVKGIYAESLLALTSPEQIYGDMLAQRIQNDIQKSINTVTKNDSVSITACGCQINITKENSGTIKILAQNKNVQEALEFVSYTGKVTAEQVSEIMNMGKAALLLDRDNLSSLESIANNITQSETVQQTDDLDDYIHSFSDDEYLPNTAQDYYNEEYYDSKNEPQL